MGIKIGSKINFNNIRMGKSDGGSIGGGAGGNIILKSTLAHDGVTPINYYGEIAADFFTGQELATLLGVTQGTLMNTDTTWFKFSMGEETIFVPKLPIRSHISWDHLYSKGLVYGTDDNGLHPTGTPTNQLKHVSKDGFDYKVRLLKGSFEDPYLGGNNVTNPPLTYGSEWNELMYRVSSANPNGTEDNFELYTDAQLGINSSTGSYNSTQEQYGASGTNRVMCGHSSVGYLNAVGSSDASLYRGWRPVLVL